MGVAILTRSEDRVQRAASGAVRRSMRCCDPHPVRRPGAASGWCWSSWPRTRCDPHPVRRPGAAPMRARQCAHPADVAILTRSEDRVQRAGGRSAPSAPTVAILTRSEDRVQPDSSYGQYWYRCPLRSSPGPKTGCSVGGDGDRARSAGVAILTRSEDRVQRPTTNRADPADLLRSSPGPKTGCSHDLVRAVPVDQPLRSSPGPKTGCSGS